MPILASPSPFVWFGGAPITVIYDGNNTLFVGGTTGHPTLPFGFRVFKKENNSLVHVQLPDFARGRGTIYVDPFSGMGMYSATDESSVVYGYIPGFQPIPRASGTLNVTVQSADVSQFQGKISELYSISQQLQQKSNSIEKQLDRKFITMSDVQFAIREWWDKEGRHIDWNQAINAQYAVLRDAAEGKNDALAFTIVEIVKKFMKNDNSPVLSEKNLLYLIGEALMKYSENLPD